MDSPPDAPTQTMAERAPPDRPAFLTTREVADLLRVKERKVYDLAAAGEIPHRRVTGKLLFPAAELMAWIDGGEGVRASAPPRPGVLTGSHDPLLDWAVRESGSGLATRWNGSLDGLEVFAGGHAALAGLHVPEADGWNLRTLAARGLADCVLIAWAVRRRGLLLRADLAGEVRGVADLRGRRLVLRQPGAGAAALLEALLAEAGMTAADVAAVATLARTESEAAAMVSAGEAEAALGIEAMARPFHLAFLPLCEERFDLLIDRRTYFTEPLQALAAFSRGEAFRARAAAMGGYDVRETGTVRWLAP